MLFACVYEVCSAALAIGCVQAGGDAAVEAEETMAMTLQPGQKGILIRCIPRADIYTIFVLKISLQQSSACSLPCFAFAVGATAILRVHYNALSGAEGLVCSDLEKQLLHEFVQDWDRFACATS